MFGVCARTVQRDIHRRLIRRHDVVLQHPGLEFLARDIGKHRAIYLQSRLFVLATLLLHLPTERRVLDDIFLIEFEIVLLEHGAHAVAPAAVSLQPGGDLGFLHAGNDGRLSLSGKWLFRTASDSANNHATSSRVYIPDDDAVGSCNKGLGAENQYVL